MIIKDNCSVCIRECKKGRSFCQRRDENGNLKAENMFCAIAVDHLSDKPIIYFGGNAKVLSIGSWGCNFRCLGCQNVNLSWSVTGDNLGLILLEPQGIVDLALKNECRGICYTYNEPAILIEAVENIASLAKEHELFNVLVTNSTLTEKSVRRIARYIDAVAADIKSLDNDFYYEYCGAAGIPDVAVKILKCIRAFPENGCHVEVRTNIIPNANDQEDNYRGIAKWIHDNLGPATPWHITRFFPAHKLSHVGQTPCESMTKAQKTGYDAGLINVQIFAEKGCDCAGEKDMVVVNRLHETHDCCKNKNK